MKIIEYIKSKEFLRTIISILVVTIILFIGLSKWMNYYTKHDQKIEVPNLEKLSITETKKILDEINLSLVVIDSTSFNPKYPPKSVIDQDPSAGDYVKENRKIYLTLNLSNYRKITVPNVLNQTKRQVVTQLRSIGFRIGNEYYIRDLGLDVVRSIEINNTEIQPGDRLPKNSSIDLVMGDGLAERDSLNTRVYK